MSEFTEPREVVEDLEKQKVFRELQLATEAIDDKVEKLEIVPAEEFNPFSIKNLYSFLEQRVRYLLSLRPPEEMIVTIIYVDESRLNFEDGDTVDTIIPADGLTWATAFTTLQDGMASCLDIIYETGERRDIWVTAETNIEANVGSLIGLQYLLQKW